MKLYNCVELIMHMAIWIFIIMYGKDCSAEVSAGLAAAIQWWQRSDGGDSDSGDGSDGEDYMGKFGC